jgi:LysM repeat protein
MKIMVRYFSWLLFLSIAITTAQSAIADVLAVDGEKYTVVKGDTLWDISALKLENPFSWTQIWEQNPGIKNPDLIYPGEKITLPPGAVLKKTGGTTEAPTDDGKSGSAPFVEKGKTIIKDTSNEVISLDTGAPPKLAVATDTQIMSAGFVRKDFDDLKKIETDGLDGRVIFSMGDLLYLGPEGVSPGDVFLIGRIGGKVKDPDSGEYLGRVFYPSGSVKITGEVDDKMAGNVENSFTMIKVDDVLIHYEFPELTYEPVPLNDALKGQFGYVAAVKEEKNTGSTGDIIYLDMGSDMGVKPGDSFIIRHSGERDKKHPMGKGYASPDDYVVPDNVAGEVQVIAVQPQTSTAKVVEIKEIIRRGYRAVYKD